MYTSELNGAWECYWALEFSHTCPGTFFWIAFDNFDLYEVLMTQTIHWVNSGASKGQRPLPTDSQDAAGLFWPWGSVMDADHSMTEGITFREQLSWVWFTNLDVAHAS